MSTHVRSSIYMFTGQVKSYIGLNVRQAWEDEQVAVYDCQERLFRYKYIGLTDIDEFIVPYAYTTLQEVIVSSAYIYTCSLVHYILGTILIREHPDSNRNSIGLRNRYKQRVSIWSMPREHGCMQDTFSISEHASTLRSQGVP